MALHEQRANDGLFLSIKRGALCLESKEPKEGYELVEGEVDGQPYTKYIKKFAALDGRISKVEWYERDSTYGKFRGIKLHIKDQGEHYSIDLPLASRPYDYFTKVAENIDYERPVEIVAWTDKKRDVTVGGHLPTAFAIKQDDKFVQWKYTREDMGDCPEAKQTRTGKWNFDDQRDWLLERIIDVVIPHVEKVNAFLEPEPEYSGVEQDADTIAERAAIESEKAFNPPRRTGIDKNDPLHKGPDETQDMPDYVKNSLEAENA